MIKTETRKTGIEYFIQLVPFEDGLFRLGNRNFASEVILPTGNPPIKVEMDWAVTAADAFAGMMYQSVLRIGESPRTVDITKYTDGKLEIDVREE